MIYDYKGHFNFNAQSISNNAPDSWGVYYCGSINQSGLLGVSYVGRAAGDGVSIKNRLTDHLRDNWSGVTHFGYKECTTPNEAEQLEVSEIKRLIPKLNQRVG